MAPVSWREASTRKMNRFQQFYGGRIIPHIFSYLETFKLILDEVTTSQAAGKIIMMEANNIDPFKYIDNTDPHLWSVRRLAPAYIANIGPTKIREIHLMAKIDLNTDDRNGKWALETAKVFRHIQRGNTCNLTVVLTLMICNPTLADLKNREINKTQLTSLLNDILEGDGNQTTFLRLKN